MDMNIAAQEASRTTDCAPTSSTQQLVDALRHPPSVFGPAAPAGLEAEHEERNWSKASKDIQGVLEVRQIPVEVLLLKLEAVARFVKTHELRLHGNPWLHVIRFRGHASMSYVVHLDLGREDADTWNERLHDVLASRDLLDLPLYVYLRERGPNRPC